MIEEGMELEYFEDRKKRNVVHTRRKLDEKNPKMIPRFSLGGW